jgi:hypothetical protein
MNPSFRFFLSTLLALIVSFAFNFFFLDLFERSSTDQILLMAFSTAALGYLIFWAWGHIIETGGLRLPKFKTTPLTPLLREHAPGIILAILFFAAYTYFGLQLNFADSDTTDNFLDADNFPWMQRIADPNGYQLEMRGPHPFAFFIIRPFGWLFNLFTSDPRLSAILLNTFVGALCVFMAWVFIKRQSQNSIYALLIAALLGLSTSHFFFGSVIESYIFSAAALIGFVLAIQKSEGTLFAPVTMSVITFGITLTNFVQSFIGFAVTQTQKVSHHDEHQSGGTQKTFRAFFMQVFKFTALALSLGIVISVIHAAWYPSSRLFFQLSDAKIEEDFSLTFFSDPQWKSVGRVILLIRTILLYTVIAPKPFVFGAEVGASLSYFNFFKITPELYSYSSYNGLGNILVFTWAALLLLSGIFFLWNLIRTRKVDLCLAFVLSLLFNFILHLSYGFEPFLYSPDWAYALIFFVGLSLAPLAKNRFFQGALLVFLILLAYNQVQFFQFILDTIAPFYGRGT